MAKAVRKGSEFVFSLTESEFKELGLTEGKEFEFINVRPGIAVLSEKQASGESIVERKLSEALDAKILGFLKSKNLSQRVEGKFEKLLSAEEMKRFNELVAEGKIVKFRLSPQYKSAVYKLKEEIEKPLKENPDLNPSPSAVQLKPKSEEKTFSLEKDGFTILKNEGEAKQLGARLESRIKAGEIQGMKSFDGEYYVINSALLGKTSAKIIDAVRQSKSISISELAEKIKVSRELAKIAMEFLKESGEILEKRKELYSYVE